MDRRLTPANDYVAHESLRGQIDAPRYTEGTWAQVIAPKVPLLKAPNGNRDRELVLGEGFCILDERDGFAFGFAQKDGYVGYLKRSWLHSPSWIATHRVGSIRTYAKEVPELKDTGPIIDLAFGSLVSVTDEQGAWSEIVLRSADSAENGIPFYVPTAHLRPWDAPFTDPANVAELFLGTPYLWGGNSSFGIDCSGLVQAALHACFIDCPGDSDLQEAALGHDIPEGTQLQRGDILFWKGHVAMVVDADRIIHANAHHMSVVYENTADAIARIEAQGDGPVTARKRL